MAGRVARLGLSGIVFSTCSIFVLFDPARAQTLTESLASAYQTNPRLAAAQAELRVVNEQVPQALSLSRPTLSLSAGAGADHEFTDTEDEDDEGPFARRLSLDLSQPVYRGGRTQAGVARAENEVLAQRARLRALEQEVLLAAATAHADVWRDQLILELNESNEQVLRQQLAASRQRLALRDVTQTDVTQAEARLAGAMAAVQAAEGRLRASRAIFEEVVGFTPSDQLAAPEAAGALPASLEDAVVVAREQNPNVVAADYAARAAERSVRQALGELYPEMSLVGSLSHESDIIDTESDTTGAQLLLELRVPLYQAGSVSSRVRAAKQFDSQRRLEFEQTQRAAERTAISAWELLTSARSQIASLEVQVEATRSALGGVSEESLAGVRTTLDVLNAEQEVLSSEIGLATAERDVVVASFELLGATGRLDVRALGLPVEPYDPIQDYREVRDAWFGLTAPGWQPRSRVTQRGEAGLTLTNAND